MNDRANILLVDDTPARLLTYEAILGSLGHNLIRARSGDEALVRLLESEVATILLDVSMPGLDGFETAALIRGHPRSAQTPIIFVTGVHLTEVDRLRGYEMGAVDYVSVPVIPEILRGKVHVLVQLYLQRRELSRLNDALIAANAELAEAHHALKAENTRELQALNRTLEQANEQLTAEIAERNRVEVQLQDAARRKDEFLAILAHELRNPLSAIHNGVQLLHADQVSAERVNWVRELLSRQVKHLTRLIDDLLDVRRITTGSVQLQREPLDLESVLEQSVEAVRSLIDARRHALRMRAVGEALHVEADPVRLTQVFINLLTNAAKYTPDGGSIDVTLEADIAQPAWAVVRVRDSGAGIAPDMLERVFELFAQANPTAARTHSGLGIGLSLVRGLVELHGGTVRAVSDGLGRGSEFIVRLPVLAGERPRASNGNGGAAFAELAPRKLLIIDDNVDTAVGLAVHLRETGGHVVRLAQTGRAGLELAQVFEPEVVLLDIGLPDIDGYEVARQLRADERLRDVPLIALTGFGSDADRARAASAGFRDYLVKPVPYQVLSEVLAGLEAGPELEHAARG
ncbi:MAG TPA: response regulator [Gammaproteobacteria bacterium]|nr:response regulator [Gammaproteobacteria bacterium]